MRCSLCAAALGEYVYSIGMVRGLCEACASKIEHCPHEHGDQRQRFDNDGVGYRVWQCVDCGGAFFDPL